MKIDELGGIGGTPLLIKALQRIGISRFYPPQAQALQAGLLEKEDSFVVASPTASGKTLIAEMMSLKTFFERRGKIIYLVPLKALAREKYEDFSKKYREIGMRVMQTTGDYDSSEPWLHEADLIIATNEKMDSLLRHHAPWLRDINLIVADEIHLLRDPQRGPTLEILLTRLRSLHPQLRFLALSATIPNGQEIADWLQARLIESDWRPVPLIEGVFYNGSIIFRDETKRPVKEESNLEVVNLALETVEEGGQALIFVNTRRATEAVARKLGKYISNFLSMSEKAELKEISEQILSASSEPTRICKKLAESVGDGAAFHHAGIISSQRKLIEDAFRANKIKCVATTTTLAMGLNLPSRRVIIRDWWRYVPGRGMEPIPAIEIKQMSGRAGRPVYDQYGEAILIARTRSDENLLFENYVYGELERIESQLGDESALRTHILASIAGHFARNRRELIQFLENTFFAKQQGTEELAEITDEIIRFLKREELIVEARKNLSATFFGRRVSELYIDPLTGIIIRDSLHMPKEKETFALLHMLTRTPDMTVLSLKSKDREEMLHLFYGSKESLFLEEEEKYPTEEALSQIKTTAVLMDWILEIPEDKIVEKFGIGPGDLRALIEISRWLLYSAAEIARLFKLKEASKRLIQLRQRVEYGVKEELLELVSLKGIGRVRARNLFNSGFKKLKDIQKASVVELAKVPALGKALAEDIKKQALLR